MDGGHAINFLLWSTSAKPYFVHLGQTIHFSLKWSKGVQMGPKGSQMVKNTWVGDSFVTLSSS